MDKKHIPAYFQGGSLSSGRLFIITWAAADCHRASSVFPILVFNYSFLLQAPVTWESSLAKDPGHAGLARHAGELAPEGAVLNW